MPKPQRDKGWQWPKIPCYPVNRNNIFVDKVYPYPSFSLKSLVHRNEIVDDWEIYLLLLVLLPPALGWDT